MSERSEILWKFYQEHCAWEGHHEQQRASVTNILVAVAAGVLGIITYNGIIESSYLPLTLFLVMQGIFGALFVAKHYERYSMHRHRAGEYRKALDELHRDSNLITLREKADEKNRQEFPRLNKLRLNKFWVSVHILIAIFGIVLSIGVFFA